MQNFYTFRHGSWSEGQLYVATMSDGTGWGRGGVTDVMSELLDYSTIVTLSLQVLPPDTR